MNIQKNIYIAIAALVILLFLGLGVWFFFFRSSAPAQTNNTGNTFVTPPNVTTGSTNNSTNSNANGIQTTNATSQVTQQKIFQITSGPVVGATLIQTLHPTTTIARFIDQEDGHVYDLPLDVPGAALRVVSNVTIPGGQRAIWVEGGSAAVMQYLDGGTVKSVYLGFPAATSSGSAVTLPTRIKFLPDAIEDIAASPDGKSLVYLLTASSGVDGYVSKSDGTGSKKLFSFPLSQMLISWPSPGFMLAQTKSAAGAPGMIFSVDAKSGAETSLVYAQGITATADETFTHVMYQSVASGAAVRVSYVHNVTSGADTPLSFSPLPEKCLWSGITTSVAYCATPIAYVPANYLDLWHMGATSAADALFMFNVASGQSTIVATPGSSDGGVQSDILEMALSADEHYLSFTTKGDRSVWGVRLTQ